jgi:hypothetical protein
MTSDRIEAVLWAASLGALRRLTDHTPLDLDSAGPRREGNGAVTILAHLTHQDLAVISAHPDIRVRAASGRLRSNNELGRGGRARLTYKERHH